MLPQWQSLRPVLIGMIHLRPLPGSPRYDGNLAAIRESALQDAEALVDGGMQGLMIENFGDLPFYPDRVPAETIAHMATIAASIREHVLAPLGINVLRNDALAAMSIAHATGASFIRVNVLSGARLADQGLIQSPAHELLRLRARLDAKQIRIMADIDVKHSVPLAPRMLAEEIDDTLHRSLADALVLTGPATGQATDLEQVMRARHCAPRVPLFIGSGIKAETIGEYLPFADGFIVGTSLKKDGIVSNPVDIARVRELASHTLRAKTLM